MDKYDYSITILRDELNRIIGLDADNGVAKFGHLKLEEELESAIEILLDFSNDEEEMEKDYID